MLFLHLLTVLFIVDWFFKNQSTVCISTMAVNFFQAMFSTVDTALASHVVNGSTALISLLSPIFTSMVIIWITIWGYMAMMGRVEGLLQDSFFRIIRIVFIISLGLTTI
jgi:type IV secretion system protein VirB6